MADPFGLSFSPGAGGANGQPQAGQKPSPVQTAIQTLSLRIPRVAGASAFTPQSLLTSPGGSALGGDPNSAALLEHLRRLLFGGPSAPSMAGPDQGPSQGQPSNPLQSLAAMFGGAQGQPAGPSGRGAPPPPGPPPPNVIPGSELPRDTEIPPPPPPPTPPTPMRPEPPIVERPGGRWA